jgi:hypothetical protein
MATPERQNHVDPLEAGLLVFLAVALVLAAWLR